MSWNLHGTKELIFDTALRMFAEVGVEQVSMRDIAKACDIKASSIYNHFEGKQKILETIYGYFRESFPELTRRIESSLDIAERGGREAFVQVLLPDFGFFPPQQRERITLCCKLIYMRMHHDDEARALFIDYLNNSKSLRKFLEHAVKAGRLHPMDLDTYCHFITGYHNFIGIEQFITPGYQADQVYDKNRFFKILEATLPFTD